MAGEARNSDLILRQARQSLADQRAGGRRAVSIGRRSAALKRQHFQKKLMRVGLALVAVYFAATVAGLARWVRVRGPCRPSKLRLVVLTTRKDSGSDQPARHAGEPRHEAGHVLGLRAGQPAAPRSDQPATGCRSGQEGGRHEGCRGGEEGRRLHEEGGQAGAQGGGVRAVVGGLGRVRFAAPSAVRVEGHDADQRAQPPRCDDERDDERDVVVTGEDVLDAERDGDAGPAAGGRAA